MNFVKPKLLSYPKTVTQHCRNESQRSILLKYLKKETHLKEILHLIPEQYLEIKRSNTTKSLYLIDKYIARDICKHMLPHLSERNQIIAETGPGLGLVAKELLKNKVKSIRLYEKCLEFRASLDHLNKLYPNRVEVFPNDLFNLAIISASDKYESKNRVSMMLKDVPKKEWMDGPCMSIFGCMPNKRFINYLLRMLAMQAEIVAHGRIQVYAIMRPSDYIILSSSPDNDLYTYQATTVLFQTLMHYQLINKYPRAAFLPWEGEHKTKKPTRYSWTIDVDQLYFVRISPKRTMPLPAESILPFYFFVRQLFGRGTNKVVPTVEKYLPDCGKRLIFPSRRYSHYYSDMSIYTQFGELNPKEILSVFKEMQEHGFANSSFEAMIQSELVRFETRETDNSLLLEDTLDSLDVDELEEHYE